MALNFEIKDLISYIILFLIFSFLSLPYLSPLAENLPYLAPVAHHLEYELITKILSAFVYFVLTYIFYKFYLKKGRPGWFWKKVNEFGLNEKESKIRAEFDEIYEGDSERDIEKRLLQLALDDVRSTDVMKKKLALEQLCQFKGNSSLYPYSYDHLRGSYERELDEKSKIAIIRAICHFHCLIYGKQLRTSGFMINKNRKNDG